MRAVILDLYPGATREMNVLLDAQESGVPREIKNAGTITDSQYAAYIQRIINEYGLQEQFVIEGLNAWIDICIAPGTAARLKKPIDSVNNRPIVNETALGIQHASIVPNSVSNVSGNTADFDTKQVGKQGAIEIVKFKGFDETTLTVPDTLQGKK